MSDPQVIFNPENLATAADILLHERPLCADKAPAGYHLPYPGFINFGMWVPQKDINALHAIASLLYQKHGPLRIAEIGSFTGATTLALANYSWLMYAIDTWRGSTDPSDEVNAVFREQGGGAVRAAFVKNTIHLSHIVLCDWHEAFWSDWAANALDLVFIDGDHRYDAVAKDIAGCRKHIAPGGIICGHDFSAEFPGVIQAATELGIDGLMGTVWWKEMP